MCEVSYNWIGTDGFEVKSETERFTVVFHVVVKTSNLVISRSSFDEYGREMLKNACRKCSTIFLVLLTNNITAFWRCRFLNSLIWSLRKTTTTMATKTPQNKRFNQQN